MNAIKVQLGLSDLKNMMCTSAKGRSMWFIYKENNWQRIDQVTL